MNSTASDPSTVVSRVVINAPIQHVWDTLTKRDEILPFFFGNVMKTTELGPGAPIRMRSPNDKYTGVVGEILEFDPPHMYSMTFKFTDLDDPLCRVTHELKEIEGGVEYTLTSSEIPVGSKTAKRMAGGGNIITSTLKKVCETGKPTFTARMIMIVSKMTGFMTPKKCLSENWPLDQKIE